MAAAASTLAVIALHARVDRSFYETQTYRTERVTAAQHSALAERKVVPIESVGVLTTADGKVVTPLERNDTMTAGISQILCYEPMFGYRQEWYPMKGLEPGPALRERNGVLNLKNPSCFLYPTANDCAPGDPFGVEDIERARDFLDYGVLAHHVPLAQRAARWLNLVAGGGDAALLRRLPGKESARGAGSGEGRARARRAVSDVPFPWRRAVGSNRLLLATVLLVWAVVAAPLVSGSRTLFQRDVFAVHLHLKWVGAAALHAGEVPAFNAQGALGQPYRGNPDALAFYPGQSFSISSLPFWSAFNLHFALHWLLAFFTMRALGARARPGASSRRCSRASTYAGSGWLLSGLTFYNILGVAAWWPLGAGRGCAGGSGGGGPGRQRRPAWPSCAVSLSPRRSGWCRSY